MKKWFLFALCFSFGWFPLNAAYVLKNGHLIDAKEVAEFPLQEHFELGLKAIKEKKWDDAAWQFRICVVNFEEADLVKEAYYYLGIACYNLNDMDCANKYFSIYLEKSANSKYFIETLTYKLACANAFKAGAKKHLFGLEKMPLWISAEDDAIKIYDELIVCLPSHELALKALFEKADLLKREGALKGAIEGWQTITKRFPKTACAATSYVKISETLVEQQRLEGQNPDLLPLAEINLKKFKSDFPQSQELERVCCFCQEMKEIRAGALYETAAFYERKGSPKSAVLYYKQAMKDFPKTQMANQCQDRLTALDTYAHELQAP